jgi:hypothetical protein
MARTTKKKNEAAAAKGQRALRAKHVSYVCAEIETHRGSNGRIPRGIMQKVFEEHKQIYPWMTINLVKKGLMKTKLNETPPINDSSISDLTMPKEFLMERPTGKWATPLSKMAVTKWH